MSGDMIGGIRMSLSIREVPYKCVLCEYYPKECGGNNYTPHREDKDDVSAMDIQDCSDCPLLYIDCPGGWTSGGGGTPIEPPCTSWVGDEVIYSGKYSRDDW